MTNLNERNCDYCGKLYSLVYTDKRGYSYLLKTKHCSKSCAQKNSKVNNCIKPDLGASVLHRKAVDFVEKTGKYCTKVEICTGVEHSCKTFYKHSLSFQQINSEAGFNRPSSAFQEKVGTVLLENFTKIESEKKFEGLESKKGNSLRVDFFIPEINTVVEADGDQHKNNDHPWNKGKDASYFDNDKIKDQYFSDNGIRLIRIPYKHNLKEKDVMSRLS